MTAVLLVCGVADVAHAQESVCARVKIEIKQELTLERQAFDAEMRITNSLPVAQPGSPIRSACVCATRAWQRRRS